MAVPWYHKTGIYQIYPRSFYDSNGDGIGDLAGVIQKLDYIQELGFETIWISPFFTSPQADFGYDISNYTGIAPEYGVMEDALQLIDEVHKRGMRIVFDMVMNHTSNEHPWFLQSRSSRDNPKADWYIWREKTNNWKSMTGGSGWHYAPERRQHYWASFLPFQPDLNYRNPEVKQAMLDVIRFWLRQGVDGFRLDIFNVIYKDAGFRNNPFTFRLAPTETNPSGFFQDAKYTLNQPESYKFAKELRNTCDEFGEKLLLGEVSGNIKVIRGFLGDETNDGLGLVFDFEMLKFKFTAGYFHNLIQNVEMHFPDPFMPVYALGNHDKGRMIHKLGGDVRKAGLLQLLQLTVRGVPCLYYGEEIGMTNLKQPFANALDPIPHKFKSIPRFVFDMLGLTINRDEVRTPMQWDGTRNAGFSSAVKPWLPVHENYREVNSQKEGGERDSLLGRARAVLKIRREEKSLREGSLELIGHLPDSVLGYARKLGKEKIVIFLNFSGREKQFRSWSGSLLYKINDTDGVENGSIKLSRYGGIMLKTEK